MANEITPLEIRSGESEAFLVTRRYRLEVWCSSRLSGAVVTSASRLNVQFFTNGGLTPKS